MTVAQQNQEVSANSHRQDASRYFVEDRVWQDFCNVQISGVSKKFDHPCMELNVRNITFSITVQLDVPLSDKVFHMSLMRTCERDRNIASQARQPKMNSLDQFPLTNKGIKNTNLNQMQMKKSTEVAAQVIKNWAALNGKGTQILQLNQEKIWSIQKSLSFGNNLILRLKLLIC